MTARWLGVLALLPLATAAAVTPAETAAVQRFLGEFCTKCHGPEKQKGEVRLDELTGEMAHEGARWSVVLDQIRDGEMPPEKEKQPGAPQKQAIVAWISAQMGTRVARRPSQGNLVPHELLFGAAAEPGNAPEPRLWRLNPEAYLAWVEEVGRGKVQGLVQPFSANPERGIKDFAALARVDEPSTEILIRNADAIVESQTAHEIVDGKAKPKGDAVREFVELMDPALAPSREQLERALQRQFQLALARRAEADESARLLAFYDRCAKAGDRPGALRTTLAAVLLRTDAIFRSELGGPGGMLSPHEAASAITAALTLRRDARIFDAAENGRLTTREQVAEQVRRILDDPKIRKPRLLGFFREYFEYDNATEIFKDRAKDLMHEPKQHVADTDRLVLHILAEDKDVFRQLLTTPLAFVNVRTQTNKQTRQDELVQAVVRNTQNNKGQANMETLYGLEEWPAQQPITLKEGTRIGILMQPSWLVAWSENFNNDIVRRGRFIRERLLGGTVPDLPIGVAAMVPNETHRTLRDRVGSVTRAEACWKCHQRMDDLGLPFEQFDHYGRLIAEEQVLDREATAANVDKKGKPLGEIFKGVPVAATGLIAGTGDAKLDGPIRTPHELLQRIAASDRARQVWIRHVFRYYLGRNEALADAKALQAADRAYVASGGSFKALLVSLLTSDSFLMRGGGFPQIQNGHR